MLSYKYQNQAVSTQKYKHIKIQNQGEKLNLI